MNMYTLAVALSIVLVSIFALQAVWNLLLSPLRHIPGPLLAKITPKWLILIDLAGNRTTTIHGLHQKYGSAVRVGPQEVSFSNAGVINEIYGQKTKFMKAPIYDHWSVHPVGIFSMRDKNEHSQRRRLLSHAFAQSNLSDAEPIIKQIIHTLVQHVDQRLNASLDMLSLFRLTAFDVVGELFLGQAFNGLNSSDPPQFLHDMDSHFLLSGIQASFSSIYQILLWLPIPAIKHFLGARHRLVSFGQSSLDKYVAQYGRDSGRRDLLTKILTSKSEQDASLTDRQASTEISNLILAGTDTTSTTLTYLFWELAKNPTWQARLRTELSATQWNGKLPSYQEVVDLPILDALINEALRLHPAAPASLPRETPAGGITLDGYYIPEKTVVSVQCYTTQRDPLAFPDPDLFLPERWMGDEAVSESMKVLYLPFSRGTRACLGKNLAMMELKLITASLLKAYEVSLGPSTTEDSMKMTDHFLVLPKGGKCGLVFTQVA